MRLVKQAQTLAISNNILRRRNKMKKIIAMTLAIAFMLTLPLTLAACDGGAQPTSDPKPIRDDTPAPTPTLTDNSGSSGDDGNNGDGDNGGDDSGNSGDSGGDNGEIVIPDNGTPPDLPSQFQTHPGDKGYFYVTTDDYAFWIDHTNQVGCERYWIMSFGADGMAVSYHWKDVYSSVDEAERRVNKGEKGQFIQTDNAVYKTPDFVADFPEIESEADYPLGRDKEFLIGQLKVQQWEHYFSMP